MYSLKIPKVFQKMGEAKGVKIPANSKITVKPHLVQLSKTLKAEGAVHAFVVPAIGISPVTALAAGAKVIAQGKAAAPIISATRALASLGDKEAARGLSALLTARAMKAKGQKIPQPATKAKAMAFKKVYTKAEVDKMAVRKKLDLTLWVRVKRWIGNHMPASS